MNTFFSFSALNNSELFSLLQKCARLLLIERLSHSYIIDGLICYVVIFVILQFINQSIMHVKGISGVVQNT